MTYHHGNLRQALLDRAAEVIAAQGVEALSLRALARDIGVSHGAPARHFKDKKSLLSALATEGYERFTAFISAAAEAAGVDPIARYNAMGRAVIRFALTQPAYYTAFNHPDVIQQTDADLRKRHKEYLSIVQQAATQAQAAGWHKGLDPLVLMTFSSAAATGAAQMFSDFHKSGLFDGKIIQQC